MTWWRHMGPTSSILHVSLRSDCEGHDIRFTSVWSSSNHLLTPRTLCGNIYISEICTPLVYLLNISENIHNFLFHTLMLVWNHATLILRWLLPLHKESKRRWLTHSRLICLLFKDTVGDLSKEIAKSLQRWWTLSVMLNTASKPLTSKFQHLHKQNK